MYNHTYIICYEDLATPPTEHPSLAQIVNEQRKISGKVEKASFLDPMSAFVGHAVQAPIRHAHLGKGRFPSKSSTFFSTKRRSVEL